MSAKPLPYCTPAMLGVLRAIADGKQPVNSIKALDACKARGWIRMHVGAQAWVLNQSGINYLESKDKP